MSKENTTCNCNFYENYFFHIMIEPQHNYNSNNTKREQGNNKIMVAIATNCEQQKSYQHCNDSLTEMTANVCYCMFEGTCALSVLRTVAEFFLIRNSTITSLDEQAYCLSKFITICMTTFHKLHHLSIESILSIHIHISVYITVNTSFQHCSVHMVWSHRLQ